MPQLLIFAPCEKLIVDQQGNPTLIAVMEHLNVEIDPPDMKVPLDALVPKEWVIFVLWKPSPGEENKDFVQVIRVVLTDGTVFSTTKQPFRFKGDGSAISNILNIMGVPIGREGPLQLQLSLEGIPQSEIIFVLHIGYKRKNKEA